MPQRTKNTKEYVSFPFLAECANVSSSSVSDKVQLLYQMLEDMAMENKQFD